MGTQTQQSTTFDNAQSSRGNDLNMDSEFYYSDSCTATNAELTPWWSVDVGGLAEVYAVSIVRRTDYYIDCKL